MLTVSHGGVGLGLGFVAKLLVVPAERVLNGLLQLMRRGAT